MTSTNQNLFIIKIEGMVNPNEVRVGNFVGHSGSMKPKMITVEDFWSHYSGQDGKDRFYYYDPIPLTPEILEKAGFTLNGFKQWKIDLLHLDVTMSPRCMYFAGDYLYLEEGERRGRDIITIWNKDVMKEFYLHSLQNLYFALTGTELNINL